MEVLLKLVGLLGSCTQYVSFSIASKWWGLVQLLLLCYIRTSELSGRLYTKVILNLLQWCRALLTVCLAHSLTISAIAFRITAAQSVMDKAGGFSLFILR